MKYLLLSILTVLIAQIGCAQDNTIYEFCETHIYKKPNGKVTIALDDGNKPFSLTDNFVKDELGEKKNSTALWIV